MKYYLPSKRNSDTCCNMDDLSEHYANRNKPVMKSTVWFHTRDLEQLNLETGSRGWLLRPGGWREWATVV